jgi:hypothetical protein
MANPIKPNLAKDAQKEENGSMQSPHSIPQSTKGVSERNNFVDVTAMIRSLQRTEGFTDCFRRGIAECDQLSCSWRSYCLGALDDRKRDNND